MEFRLYNTRTRSVEPLASPAGGRPLGVYTCGPTVYARVHLGNLRTAVSYDLLVRTLRARGVPVTWVQNITDVEDRILTRSQEAGESLEAFTHRFEAAFLADVDALGCARPDVLPRATEHVPEMIALVQALEARGHTYVADGSVWFRVASFAPYGRLARLDAAGLKAGARVAADDYDKQEVRDFALWKGWVEADGPVGWDSPWGRGRPGWHLECSAMARKYLGDTVDVHAGGEDLVFPHHENEIAQSEAATGVPFVRHWFHTAFLNLSSEKMSKRLGNVKTLDAVAELGLEPLDFRYFCCTAQYRQPMTFSPDDLQAKAREREGLRQLRRRLREATGATVGPATKAAEAARAAFDTAMADDLNVAGALGALNTLRAEANRLLDTGGCSAKDASAVEAAFAWADRHLACLALPDEPPLPAAQADRVAAREAARARRDWAEADRLRDALAAEGIRLEDTPAGTRWRRGRA